MKQYLTVAVVGVCLLSVERSFAFYNPVEGRWLDRDPIEGSLPPFPLTGRAATRLAFAEGNDLSFVRNDPSDFLDGLGLFAEYVNCTCCQVLALDAEERAAQAEITMLMLNIHHVLPDIVANPSRYPYRTAGKFNTALNVLTQASRKLSEGTVKCDPRHLRTIAKSEPFGNIVTVFDSYWTYGLTAQGAHLLHEGTHMGGGTTDAAYFWQHHHAPRDTWFVPWDAIASTYDTWVLTGFCIPGYNCPAYVSYPPYLHRSQKECP